MSGSKPVQEYAGRALKIKLHRHMEGAPPDNYRKDFIRLVALDGKQIERLLLHDNLSMTKEPPYCC